MPLISYISIANNNNGLITYLRINLNDLHKYHVNNNLLSKIYDTEHNKYLKENYLNEFSLKTYPVKYQYSNMEDINYH